MFRGCERSWLVLLCGIFELHGNHLLLATGSTGSRKRRISIILRLSLQLRHVQRQRAAVWCRCYKATVPLRMVRTERIMTSVESLVNHRLMKGVTFLPRTLTQIPFLFIANKRYTHTALVSPFRNKETIGDKERFAHSIIMSAHQPITLLRQSHCMAEILNI